MPYQIESFDFLSSNKADTVTGCLYIPEQVPQAVIQISHGMCEHIERYQAFMAFLAQHGYAVIAHNHIGHKGSVTGDEKLGYFAAENGYQCMVKDLYTVTGLAKKRFPGSPYFLLGHSMGSFLARLYTEIYSNELDGLILSGTGGANPASGIGVALAKTIKKIKGERYRPKGIEKMAFGAFSKRIDNAKTGKEWLSRDLAVVNQYINDPYCMFIFTVSGFLDLFALLETVNRSEWFGHFPKSLPTLLFSGDEDPVGNYGKGVRQVYDGLKNAAVEDLSIKLYPGGRHEMLNEINRTEVYDDILHWLSIHLPQTP